MTSLKVVITEPWGERLGGAEIMLWAFLRHVDRRRISPLVVFFEPGPFEREVAGLGISTAVLPAGRLRQVTSMVRVVWSLGGLLRRERPDLVLNWMPKTQLYGAPAAMAAGIANRVVWWQHGVSKGHWMDRLATLLPACAVGCSSRSAASVQLTQRPRRPTFVVYPGIDPLTPLGDGELRALRIPLGIPGSRTIIGTVGRLQPDRGQHRVLRVLAELRKRGHDVHGLIVGGNAYNLSPGYESSLYRLVDELGLAGAVTFTGQVPRAGPYIQLMDVLLNASLGESFGIALLEGMALGVSVIAFDATGPAEIIESGRSGLLIPPDDQLLLAEGLERLIRDEEFRRHLGDGGRQRFYQYFTVHQMVAGLSSHLEELSTGKARSLVA